MARAIFAVLVIAIIVVFEGGLRPNYNELIPTIIVAGIVIFVASRVMKSLFRGMFK
jgi:hypothetical protein